MSRMKWILIPAALLCLLTGCNSRELEERNFPLAAVFDYEDTEGYEPGGYQMTLGMQQLKDVADEKATKEHTTNVTTTAKNCYQLFELADIENPGTMDYNHMKALILHTNLMENPEKLEELLDYLSEQELIARNTLLFAADVDGTQLMDAEEILKEPVGTYLDEMIASDVQGKKREAVTLGSLYNVWNNQNENLYIPFLSMQEDKPVFDAYYLLQGRVAVGIVERSLGDVALLVQQKLDHYGMELEDGTIMELSNISCRYELEPKEKGVTATIHVQADAARMDGRIEDDAKQAHIKEETQEMLGQILKKATEKFANEMDVDISNSFYRLGAYDRKLWERYRDDWQGYRKQLAISYDITISPVNL